MAAKPDIKQETPLDWNRYAGKPLAEALQLLHAETHAASLQKRNWYWRSIKVKRWTSLWARFLAFLLLLGATALPLLAGLSDAPAKRLLCTQIAVTLLATAGLLQVADKVFGWSTGWMRYITTATAMESSTNVFDIEWSKHLIARGGAVEAADLATLFALSEGLRRELDKFQAEETNGWVAEFNAGLSLLDTVIKAQREETQKQMEALKTTAATAAAEAKAEEKARADAEASARKASQPGTIDVSLTFKSGPRPVSIGVLGTAPQEYNGVSWSSSTVAPGIHTVEVQTLTDPKETARGSVTVEPGKVAKLEIKLAS